jgi:ribosome-associated heat shock protein Hsp15
LSQDGESKCRAAADLRYQAGSGKLGLYSARLPANEGAGRTELVFFGMNDAEDGRVRLDKWLWAARFYKTRSLAAEAIAGGKVQVNGDRVKRAKPVQLGDEVRIRQSPYEHQVVVRQLSDRRGPAAQAAELYQEKPESLAAREALTIQLKTLHSAFLPERGKPTKKDRREINRLKGRER